jgi:hypothetical protein
MDNITKASNDNLGGVSKIWIVLKDDISEIAYDTTEPNLKLTLTPTGNLYHIYCTTDTIQFIENEKTDFNGTYFECSLSGITPNNHNDLQAILDELDNKEFVIVFKDYNGNYKLFGNLNEPLTLQDNYSSKADFSGFNSHALTFSRKLRKRTSFIISPF